MPGEDSDRNSFMAGDLDRDPVRDPGKLRNLGATPYLDIVRGHWTGVDTAVVPASRQAFASSVFASKPQMSRSLLVEAQCNADQRGRVKWRMEPY